jgi:hypothetical protein
LVTATSPVTAPIRVSTNGRTIWVTPSAAISVSESMVTTMSERQWASAASWAWRLPRLAAGSSTCQPASAPYRS